MNRKPTLGLVLGALLCTVIMVTAGAAQTTPQNPQTRPPEQRSPQTMPPPTAPSQDRTGASAGAQNQQTLTGCVRQSGENFTLTTQDGQTWMLSSASAATRLDSHVGHTVTVTGSPRASASGGAGAGASEPGQRGQAGASAQAARQLAVSNVTMVSTSCQNSGTGTGTGGRSQTPGQGTTPPAR
jgi:hypothetical protein